MAPPKVVDAMYAAKRVDLHAYNQIRVLPAEVSASGAPQGINETWANLLAERLREQSKLPEVSVGSPTGKAGELVVSTKITALPKMSKDSSGGSSVIGMVTLSDAKTADLFTFPIDTHRSGDIVTAFTSNEMVLKNSVAIASMIIGRAKWR